MTSGDSSTGAPAPSYEYEVALSFAGADRSYAAEVARELETQGVRCFYDAKAQVGLWGKSLAEELPRIYSEASGVVVVFVSAAYAQRHWTRVERRAALDRAARERREYLLPARLDDTALDGVLASIAHIDLRTCTPAQFAVLIVAKLEALGIRTPSGPTPTTYLGGQAAEDRATRRRGRRGTGPAAEKHRGPARGHRPYRRRQALIVAVALAIAIIVGVTLLLTVADDGLNDQKLSPSQADAVASRIIADAYRLRIQDPILAGQLAMAAYHIAPTAAVGHAVLDLLGPRTWAKLTGHSNIVYGTAFTGDGHLLATASADRTARLWDVSNPRAPIHLATLVGHDGPVIHVAFSRDGRTLATTSDDRTARLWDVSNPRKPAHLATLTGHRDWAWGVAFFPDGRTLVTTSRDGTVRLWDIAQPDHPTILAALTDFGGPVGRLALSPDSRTLATSSDDSAVRLWDVTNPRRKPTRLATLTGHDGPVNGVAFSPDGHTLASAGIDHTVRLWDVTTLDAPTLLATLTGHNGPVSGVAFSPDGHTLATTSDDHTGRLWDVTNPSEPTHLATLTGHKDFAWGVAFSPDGRFLVTTSYDHTARIWGLDLDPAHIVRDACTEQSRISEEHNGISEQSWRVYIPQLDYDPPCR